MKKGTFEIGTRTSINALLEGPFHKKGEFIEVTEWTNGEGYDVTVGTFQTPQMFSLHNTEWELLIKLIKQINKS